MSEEDPYDRLKNLSPELVARLKAGRDQSRAEIARINEEYARTFKPRGFVYGSYRTPNGNIDPDSVFTIAEWGDDYGNTVYIRKGSKEKDPLPDQIGTLSGRIQTQQADFNRLDPSEQSRIRTEFTSLGNRTDNRFGAYLANEALGVQFQKLK